MRRLACMALLLLSCAASAQPARQAAASCPTVALAGRSASAVSVPSAPDAWGGPRDGAATLSNRVVRYDIDARLDPDEHSIVGKQKLTWRNRSAQPVCSVYLHLYLNAFEGPGSTFMTEQRAGGRFRSGVASNDGDWGWIRLQRVQQAGKPVPQQFVQPDGGPASDRTVVRLDLPQPVPAGGSTTLDIDFLSQLPRVVARTGHFKTFHLVAQWFPKIAVLELPGERGATAPRWNAHEFHLHSEFYADFGEFDVRIDVPEGWTVGATGELQGTPVARGGRVVHRYVQADVHDFAWTADKRFAEPLESSWSGPGSPQVKLRVLFHPEHRGSAEPAMQATKDSLEYFSRTLGPYPYRTVTVVVPPLNASEAGGMEYPTFYTAMGYERADPGTMSRHLLDFVTIHEFGHGYFYGILASNEFEEPALDEGVNEYWNQRMLGERKQGWPATTPWLQRLGIGFQLPGFDQERLSGGLADPSDALGVNSWTRLSSGSYGTVYSRTAAMLHQLENQVGSAAMERAFKLYYQRWKFRHPSFADFREALAEGTGQRELVERTFAQHVFGAQRVDDRVASLSSSEIVPTAGWQVLDGKHQLVTAKQVRERIAQARKAAEGRKAGAYPYRTVVVVRRDGAAVPQLLQVRFADGSVREARFDGPERWRRFTWETPSQAVSAQLDPAGQVVMDHAKHDDGRTREADRTVANRWTADLAALLQTLFALLASA